MASSYPTALDTFAITHISGETIAATTDNDQADAVNKIEAELGTDPSGTAATVKLRLDAIETVAFNTQTGTTYTLVLADVGKVVGMNNAATNTLTIPTNATVAYVVGTQIVLRQVGAGQTTVAAAGGVTLNSRGAAYKLAGQYGYATLLKVATDSWEMSGDIAV